MAAIQSDNKNHVIYVLYMFMVYKTWQTVPLDFRFNEIVKQRDLVGSEYWNEMRQYLMGPSMEEMQCLYLQCTMSLIGKFAEWLICYRMRCHLSWVHSEGCLEIAGMTAKRGRCPILSSEYMILLLVSQNLPESSAHWEQFHTSRSLLSLAVTRQN